MISDDNKLYYIKTPPLFGVTLVSFFMKRNGKIVNISKMLARMVEKKTKRSSLFGAHKLNFYARILSEKLKTNFKLTKLRGFEK